MKLWQNLAAAAVLGLATTASAADAGVYAFSLNLNDGSPKKLADYKGKALLVVNTASKCGYTKQYAPMEQLYQKYKDRGFEVLAFPANNFMGQEPGTNEEIRAFCTAKFNTTFPLFAKISVKGDDIHPLYKYLTTLPEFSGDITWNFNKFLVDPSGKVVARFGSKVDPMSEELTKKLEEILPKKG
ncbi:MAG: glutathione peroxidase [Holophagales bacterium]|nr:glutathione peroxidase [Holophagales bacterium]